MKCQVLFSLKVMIIKNRMPYAAVLFSVLRVSYRNNRLLNVLLIFYQECVLFCKQMHIVMLFCENS